VEFQEKKKKGLFSQIFFKNYDFMKYIFKMLYYLLKITCFENLLDLDYNVKPKLFFFFFFLLFLYLVDFIKIGTSNFDAS
jgi:hypothetical protein